MSKNRCLLILPVLPFGVVYAYQIDILTVLEKKELVFISDSLYQNPHSELILSITFKGHKGEEIEHTGYWGGNNMFKARFAPPTVGLWSYTAFSSDDQNRGLLNQRGLFYVKEYKGDNEFRNKGWLKVFESGRYLEYGDGTPFFYLGDTAWKMGWKSTRSELSKYLDNGESKGFNVIHTVPLSHQYLSKNGRRNRYGEDFFIDENLSKINPRYFDYIDEIVDSINNRGMVVTLVPLLGWLNELRRNSDWGDNYIDIKQSKLIARYIASRYAANNIVWIIGGDDCYNTDERKSFWDEFTRIVKNSTGWRQLATRGWSTSADNEEKVVITASTSNHIGLYFPANLRSKINYSLPRDTDVKSAKYMNPTTREELWHSINDNENSFSLGHPDAMDWVFIMEVRHEEVISDPSKSLLYQNYPNPFNPNTIIEYYVDKNAEVKLIVYDSIGWEVNVLLNENKTEGFHIKQFNGRNKASGIYFYRLYIDGTLSTKKMTLVK